jgi:hypothetical protein
MTVAGFLLLASQLSEERKNQGRLWVRPTLSKRKMYGGDKLLIDWGKDDTGLVENYDEF